MSTVDLYLRAATRDNTERSYQAAVRHFEVDWGGLLPASSDTIALYLADNAEALSINTLQQRLAALANWHRAHGFLDPTKAQVVRKVLKGIRTLHSTQEKQARPLQLEQIGQLVHWLDGAIAAAQLAQRQAEVLRYTRDRALLLLGFWRGFRGDELARLQVQYVDAVACKGMSCFLPQSKGDREARGRTFKAPALQEFCPVKAYLAFWRGFRGDELARLQVQYVDAVACKGMSCFLPQSKGDREARGRTFKAPALQEFCPVKAYLAWITLAGLTEGPVFRAVDRWGNVSDNGLHINSLVPLLRSLFNAAAIPFVEQYSGHSLRRGFTTWATSNGWDVKTLMEYVGWRDVQSAMRYVESSDPFAAMRQAASPASST
jgi:integrase